MAWMIYGATGYTGHLVVETALQRGHKPILAGRTEAKVKALAERFNLPYIVFGLPDVYTAIGGLREAAQLVDEPLELVLNCAGPFIYTAESMIKACLDVGAHYLDITGEVPVFELGFSLADAAKDCEILLMSGVGFDIVPTDCLARYVTDGLNDPVLLELAFDGMPSASDDTPISAGTMKSVLEMLPNGGYIRRGGELVHYDLGQGARTFKFPHGERMTMPIIWGDLATAYRSTGVPNIITYMAMPPDQIRAVQRISYISRYLLKVKPIRSWLAQQIELNITGPSRELRESGQTFVYAKAVDAAENSKEAWLRTAEGYLFTAEASLLSVERVLDGNFTGTQTPAMAFGADFVLDVPGSERFDSLV